MEYADRALEIARRVGDTDLETLALQDRGRALVALGRVKEGMALIDEAMTAATAGELTPRTTGRAYCNMLSICERLGDFGRAAEWYEAAATAGVNRTPSRDIPASAAFTVPGFFGSGVR